MTEATTKPKAARLTPEQRLAKLDAERTKLAAELAAKSDPQRAGSIDDIIAMIKDMRITKAELAAAWPRKRAFAPRVRKATTPSIAAPAAVTSGMSSIPPAVRAA
jgi:hypothetical protein